MVQSLDSRPPTITCSAVFNKNPIIIGEIEVARVTLRGAILRTFWHAEREHGVLRTWRARARRVASVFSVYLRVNDGLRCQTYSMALSQYKRTACHKRGAR